MGKNLPFFPLSDALLTTNLSRKAGLQPISWGRCLKFNSSKTLDTYFLGDFPMGKRDDLIAVYADDLKNKCGMTPDMDLLTKVTIGCGPAIYNADASTVAGSQAAELETVKNNFLIKKLGLSDSPALMEAINSVIETYGKSERNKYRVVVYYMLAKHFGKEAVYG
jgi:hypothetical protein